MLEKRNADSPRNIEKFGTELGWGEGGVVYIEISLRRIFLTKIFYKGGYQWFLACNLRKEIPE